MGNAKKLVRLTELNLADLRKVPVPLPSRSTQLQIIAIAQVDERVEPFGGAFRKFQQIVRDPCQQIAKLDLREAHHLTDATVDRCLAIEPVSKKFVWMELFGSFAISDPE